MKVVALSVPSERKKQPRQHSGQPHQLRSASNERPGPQPRNRDAPRRRPPDSEGLAAIYLDGTHLCTQMRGVRETDSVTGTTFWRGHYAQEPTLRAEFLHICEMRSGKS